MMADHPPFRYAIAFVAVGLLLGACQKVGSDARPSSGPSDPPVRAVDGVRGGPLAAGDVLPIPALEVGGIDAILHSPASRDPGFHDQVEFWVRFWTEQQDATFARYLERMGQWEAFVDAELVSRDLPASLRYLPIVESGYHPGVVSRAGATGMWQIMAPTAEQLGLTVSSIVDDRRDPQASTYAALDYLEELHDRFDSWFLALAAYNAGPGRVRGVLDRHGVSDLSGDEQFLEVLPHLPAETREFVPRFFAAAILSGNAEEFGFTPPEPAPISFDQVRVPDATSLDVIARAAEVAEELIVELNPHFLRGYTPAGEERAVRVPAGGSDVFEANFALVPPSERLTFVEHEVASGETFSHIAGRYQVALSDLVQMNRDIDPQRLQIGMRVVVPVSPGAREEGGIGDLLHVVARGESLWTISRRYGVSAEALARMNERSPEAVIQVGEELLIP